jgi:hypothetical protein
VNAVEIAINGARVLSAADVGGHLQLLDRALEEMRQGRGNWGAWCALADASNMAESFSAMGIGSGTDADTAIKAASCAMAAIHERQSAGMSWTLYPGEIDSLHWLVRLHRLQLQSCSYREFATAFDRTVARVRGAVAGNATAGAVVLVGSLCDG